jgi:ornithine cyclodeaminase
LLLLAIGRDDIRQAITITDAIQAARVAFEALATGAADVPPRPHLTTSGGSVLVMPAYGKNVGAIGVKIVSVTPDNASRGIPTVQGVVVLVDAPTGRPTALIDGTFLTQLRTGAAIGLAADLLARSDATTVALFGVGGTARTSLWAVCATRPIREVRVVHPHAENYPAFVAAMRDFLGDLTPVLRRVERSEDAINGADVVITATTSPSPVFDGGLLRPGTFVGALGAYRPSDRELDDATILRSRVVVDTRDAALREAGDVVIPIREGRLAASDIWAELGEILLGTRPGRMRTDEIFVFKSVGSAIQDLALASCVYERALDQRLGTTVSL